MLKTKSREIKVIDRRRLDFQGLEISALECKACNPHRLCRIWGHLSIVVGPGCRAMGWGSFMYFEHVVVYVDAIER